jgi:mannosyl-oligosaccharide glucosidase
MDKKSIQPQIDFLKNVYPKFKRQYDWFHNTQIGQVNDWDYGSKIKLGFKWRGREGKHILTSGMDDFPRSAVAHPGDLHVDLISWVSYFAKRLEGVANVLGYEKDVKLFKSHQKLMSETLDKVHWNPETNTYSDVTIAGNSRELVVHVGYVSITPLLLGLIPYNSPKLGAILDVVRDPNVMWSDYGICSLSKQDEFFGVDENYWRGPIWINMNYLLLQSLSRHYLRDGPHQQKAKKIYEELRKNLINNVFQVVFV